MTGVPGTQGHGEIPGEDEGRDPGDASLQAKGRQSGQQPPKGGRLFPRPLRMKQPWDTLTSGFWASRS